MKSVENALKKEKDKSSPGKEKALNKSGVGGPKKIEDLQKEIDLLK